MRLVRLLIALLLLGTLFLSGQACLLHGSHVVAAEVCGDHDDEHEADSRCGSCGQDLALGQAMLALPAAPLAVVGGLDPLLALLAGRHAAHVPASEVDPPPDPVLVRRAFLSLTRTLPVRGPNVLG